MRRILLVLSVAAITASMMVLSAVPAFAEDDKVELPTGEIKDDKSEFATPFTSGENKDDKIERETCLSGCTFSSPTLDQEIKFGDKSETILTFQSGASRTTECKVGETCEFTTQPPPS